MSDASSTPSSAPWRHTAFWPGLALVLGVAVLALWLAQQPILQGLGLSALTLAIVLGIVLGNSLFPRLAPRCHGGVDFAKSWLLRLGIILYGFRITLQDIAGVGMLGLAIDLAVVIGIFALALWSGTRWFKLDRETAMLIGAGSAICGAAAVVAAEPIVKAQSHKVSVAVATVVVFGTLGMFLYPWLYPLLGLSEHGYGLFVGSTVHEVAQVVVAGNAISAEAGATAVIEKMLRVMLLAPFLFALAWYLRPVSGSERPAASVSIPWFALLFIACAGFNSLQLVPAPWVERLVQLDTLLLAMAMTALGLRTHFAALREAGLRPLLLAGSLFLVLLFGGWGLNLAVADLLN